MTKAMLGFDIGACELKLALWDGGCVRWAVSVPLPDHLVKNGVIISYTAMTDFIKETLREQHLKVKDCAVILPAAHAFLRRVTMPAMTVEQLRINLPYEFRDFLSLGKDQYFYDYAVNNLVTGEDGRPQEMDLTAAAVPKEIIGEYREMFRRAGLRLRTAIPAECAYSNLLRARQWPADREIAFLDLGHTASRLYIYTGTRFEATRAIDIGLATLDAAIADAMGVDEHLARTYKLANHQDVQSLESAHSIYNAIALDVRKAVNFYNFNNQGSDLRELVCCGGGAHIPALLEAIGQSVGLLLSPAADLLPPAQGDEENYNICAAAIGAAIQ
ncbi:MAG: pilus assembly protein PilM [Bacillota bacterium]|nr:pilus assembly protein PilM [Bacillota bacterium]